MNRVDVVYALICDEKIEKVLLVILGGLLHSNGKYTFQG